MAAKPKNTKKFDMLSVADMSELVQQVIAEEGVTLDFKLTTEQHYIDLFNHLLGDKRFSAEGKLRLSVAMYRREYALHLSLQTYTAQVLQDAALMGRQLQELTNEQ